MINTTFITNEFARLTDLRVLVSTYQLLASTSMQRIRNSVLVNRAFHEGLNHVFQIVKRMHEKEFAVKEKKAARAAAGGALHARKGNAFVFLSANTGLYGDVVMRSFERFLWVTRKEEGTIVIIGKIGKSLFEEKVKSASYRYFDFPDNRMDVALLRSIAAALTEFNRVIVVHGVFKSFLAQDPAASNISGDLPFVDGAEENMRYLIEPDPATVTAFFEKEIFASLLEQAFNESRLAKLAGRMMLLERSGDRISRSLKEVSATRVRLRHQAVNKKQVNALSGVALWDRV